MHQIAIDLTGKKCNFQRNKETWPRTHTHTHTICFNTVYLPKLLLSVLRLAVKSLLSSFFTSWPQTTTGFWLKGSTCTASSSWPSSLTRTTCGLWRSSAGVIHNLPNVIKLQVGWCFTLSFILLYLFILTPGVPAVFVSIWVSARATLADTQ